MDAVSPRGAGREFLIPEQHVKRGREPAEESQPCLLSVCACVRSPSAFVAHPSLTPIGPHRGNHTANVSSGKDG